MEQEQEQENILVYIFLMENSIYVSTDVESFKNILKVKPELHRIRFIYGSSMFID